MKFPIIRLNKLHLRKFRSKAELSLMSEKYFIKGSFCKNAIIIDSTGSQFSIEKVVKLRKSINPLRWFRSSPAIVVEVQARQIGVLSLDETKNKVIDLVTANNWNVQGSQSANEFREYVVGAQSFEKLFEKLSFYGKWQG